MGKWILSCSDLPLTRWHEMGDGTGGCAVTGVPEQIGHTGRWSMAYDKSKITSHAAATILKDAVLSWLDEGVNQIQQRKFKLLSEY